MNKFSIISQYIQILFFFFFFFFFFFLENINIYILLKQSMLRSKKINNFQDNIILSKFKNSFLFFSFLFLFFYFFYLKLKI